MIRRAVAPGRVNLIGDHTDHTGGLVLPMAIDRATTVELRVSGEPVLTLVSEDEDAAAALDLPVGDPAAVRPAWARYVAGVAAELGTEQGGNGTVSTTVPIGAGLSSSAALLVAVALALGADPGDPRSLARLCQRAEQRASGVPCGIMDPLTSLAGRSGHALLIDTSTAEVDPVELPPDVDVVVVHSGAARRLEGSPYAERRARCVAAAELLGPLRELDEGAADGIDDPVVRAAARHLIGENRRVREAASALRQGDVAAVGALMDESHASLRDDLGVSTPLLDAIVTDLGNRPGVLGARLTGAGFGGCAVALCRPGAIDDGWVVRPSAGAAVTEL